MSADKF